MSAWVKLEHISLLPAQAPRSCAALALRLPLQQPELTVRLDACQHCACRAVPYWDQHCAGCMRRRIACWTFSGPWCRRRTHCWTTASVLW